MVELYCKTTYIRDARALRINHGTYIGWYFRNKCARKNLCLLFDLLQAFNYIESSHKSKIFSTKGPIFLHAYATCSELPSNISTMG